MVDDTILDDSISPVDLPELHQTRNRPGDLVAERKQLLVKNMEFQCDSCGTFYKNKRRLNVETLNFFCDTRKSIHSFAFCSCTIKIVT